MSHETPLERARREYARVELAAGPHQHILHELQKRVARPQPSLIPALGLGLALGSVFMLGFALLRTPPAGEGVSAQDSAIALKVRGVVHSHADGGDAQDRVVPNQGVMAGRWLETDAAASVGLALGRHRVDVAEDSSVRLDSLNPNRVSISVAKGRAAFHVDPLPKGASLSVRSGGLLVEVVGTTFSVERREDCSILTVAEGLVRATFHQTTAPVAQGRTERYCETRAASSDHAVSAPGVPPATSATVRGQTPVAHSRRELGSEGTAGAPARSLTPEERQFRQGLDALRSGNAGAAQESFEAYLRDYAQGAFSQDARLHLVRLSYAAHRTQQTVSFGRQFLAQAGASGARGNEVRLLVAQSLLEGGGAADEAFGLLAPLVTGAHASSRAFDEQVVYVYILAASRSGRLEEASSWARKYLEQRPQGRYAVEARKIAGP